MFNRSCDSLLSNSLLQEQITPTCTTAKRNSHHVRANLSYLSHAYFTHISDICPTYFHGFPIYFPYVIYISHVFPNTLEVNHRKKNDKIPTLERMVQLGSPNRTKQMVAKAGLPPGIHFSKKITTHPDRAHPKESPPTQL